MNTFKVLLLSFLINLAPALAGVEQAPPSFTIKGKKAVWLDFTSAKYELTFDIRNKKSVSVATIDFDVLEKGYPIFDVVNTPRSISMNGTEYNQLEVQTPGGESKVRIIDRELSPGNYTVRIVSDISNGVLFEKGGLSVGFFTKDMRDRNFLERYLPSNYEYDQYKMDISVNILGSKKKYKLFSNGSIVNENSSHFHYTYPEYFSASSLYFHLVPVDKFKILNFNYESRLENGSNFPVTVYSKKTRLSRRVKRKIIKVLKELENDYGPWPHPHLIFYADGKWKGGMEYAGAATAGWFAIGHELQHNYFARAVMPANGDAGWIDEAVASWRDFYKIHKYFHFGKERIKFDSMNLGSHSVYTRKTDLRSYKNGRALMFYLDSVLKDIPGKSLKKFLRSYFQERKFSTIKTEDFKNDLESYSGLSFKSFFDQYIYGLKKNTKSTREKDFHFHTSLSESELQELL